MIKEFSGIQYQVEECEHPEYAGMSSSDIRKVINIDDGEQVPAGYRIMIIIKPLIWSITQCEEMVMDNEGITERSSVIFE